MPPTTLGSTSYRASIALLLTKAEAAPPNYRLLLKDDASAPNSVASTERTGGIYLVQDIPQIDRYEGREVATKLEGIFT